MGQKGKVYSRIRVTCVVVTLYVIQDMFRDLAPVLSGFGMKMMKKMGWNEGQPLGRMGKGVTEPIAMSVKVDRAG